MRLLSVIVPVYNEEESIENTLHCIVKVLNENSISYELIVVDDGSHDNTFGIISKFAENDNRINGISFSRNFGKEAAMMAGIRYATGDSCVIIDGDLQHPPEVIPQMYKLWCEGYDIVDGMKSNRGKESKLRKFLTKGFYAYISREIGVDIENASDFKLIDRKVMDILTSLPETYTFFRGLTSWTGYKTAHVTYDVAPRLFGKTKWTFKDLIRYAVKNIIIFSSAPLKIISVLAFFMLFCSAYLTFRAFRLYFTHQAAAGLTSVVLLILLVGGLILLSLAIIGQYVASIYDEVKKRPKYLVNRTTGMKKNL